jgi:hypothetical protein
MLTTLTLTFAALATAWTAAWFRLHGSPLPLRTIPITATLRIERDLVPAPLA